MKLCCLGLILLCVGCGAKVVKQFEVGNFQSVEVINSGDWTKSNIMKITTDKGIQSYKEFYINKFYETLLSHLICLRSEGGSEKEKMDLMLGSILKDKGLYKYTRYKDVLEKMFEVQNK